MTKNPLQQILLAIFLLLLTGSTSAEESSASASCASSPCINGVCRAEEEEVEANSNSSSSVLNDTANGGYRCFCLEGFTGVHCEHRYDHCLPGRNRCQNNGTCVNQGPPGNSTSVSYPRCICPPGFCGRFCEEEVDDCASAPCLNGGMCLDRHLAFTCLCPPGYLGDRCEVDVDACSEDFLQQNASFLKNISRHCENGGLCVDGPGLSYSCKCPRGFEGSRCEKVVNYCLENRCQNGGRCESALGSFRCICAYGWTGPLCDRPLKPCSKNSPNVCHNGGLCMEEEEEESSKESAEDSKDSSLTFCFCAPDYHGRHCELRYDECTPNQCQNGGVCVDQVDGFSCRCEAGFAGEKCEIDCEASPGACLTTTTTSTTPETPSLSPSETPELNTTATSTTTEVQLITPTPTLPSAHHHSHLERIFSPRFEPARNSSLTFRVRRLKRRTSVVQFDLLISTTSSEEEESLSSSGTILYANSSSSSSSSNTTYHLELTITESQLKARLWNSEAESSSENHSILSLQNSYPLQREIRYTVVLSLSKEEEEGGGGEGKSSVIGELSILNSSNNELLSSVSAKSSRADPETTSKNALTSVPCFETYQFGSTSSSSSSSSFSGCLQKVLINGEERWAKDAVQGAGITECSSSVCKAASDSSVENSPCQNNGTCVEESSPLNWSCKCPAGFGGWLCAEAQCEEGFCKNGGLCLLTGAESSKDSQQNLQHHLCVCTAGFKGARCEEKVNLTFPLFNIGPPGSAQQSSSFIKYRLPFDLRQFFEIRFRFIAHELGQRSALLMFMSSSSSSSSSKTSNSLNFTGNLSSSSDFISLLYSQRRVLLRLNLGQGERTLVSPIEANVTEQMVLFGRFHQTFWLLVVPAGSSTSSASSLSSPPPTSSPSPSLSPLVGRMPLHHRYLNVDPYLWVGGHEDWAAHPALAGGLVGFKGCIYDVELRASSKSNTSWTRLDETLVERVSGVQQCDFECT